MPDTIDTVFDTASAVSSFVPGVGTVIGAGLGIAKGAYDLIKGNREKKKAQGLMPPLEDPETRQYLSYLDRKRKSIETGSAYGRQANNLNTQLANTQTGIVQSSGGAGGAAISGLLQAQRGAGEAYGDLVEKNAPLVTQYEGMYGHTLDQIAHRKAELQLNQWKQAQADAAALHKSGEEAIMGGIARVLPMGLPARTPFVNPTANSAPVSKMSTLPMRSIPSGQSGGLELRTTMDNPLQTIPNASTFPRQSIPDTATTDQENPLSVLFNQRGKPNPLIPEYSPYQSVIPQ